MGGRVSIGGWYNIGAKEWMREAKKLETAMLKEGRRTRLAGEG